MECKQPSKQRLFNVPEQVKEANEGLADSLTVFNTSGTLDWKRKCFLQILRNCVYFYYRLIVSKTKRPQKASGASASVFSCTWRGVLATAQGFFHSYKSRKKEAVLASNTSERKPIAPMMHQSSSRSFHSTPAVVAFSLNPRFAAWRLNTTGAHLLVCARSPRTRFNVWKCAVAYTRHLYSGTEGSVHHARLRITLVHPMN